ncbi:MAG: methyltransferase domain-containing protein [Thauera sp.]|jgi:O-antigen chain-terminating methyltransferase|nr:methyltransferase domain-containing protein [Thauera sp.]
MKKVLCVGALLKEANPTWQLRHLQLAFSAETGPHELHESTDGAVRTVRVHSRWQAFGADFAQQLANRVFADELLSLRPELVVISELSGASMDMVRIAALLGYPVLLRVPELALPAQDSRSALWLRDVFRLATALYRSGNAAADEDFCRHYAEFAAALLPDLQAAVKHVESGKAAAGPRLPHSAYASYAFGMRDHGLLYRMQQGLVAHFRGCKQVLELACGTGVFLELLRQHDIPAQGVERDAASVRYARGLGLEVAEDDALVFLRQQPGHFDGIYCSHFVEHLPIEAVEQLIALIADSLQPGGVVVLTFPDPESIRSQLLGFWRDPEHVRFYHPDLVELIGRSHGLQPVFHSHRVGQREVIPFSFQPPLTDGDDSTKLAADLAALTLPPPGRLERLLARFGLVHPRALQRLELYQTQQRALEHDLRARQAARTAALENALRTLWTVNQTWAWDDNAVVCLRKPG